MNDRDDIKSLLTRIKYCVEETNRRKEKKFSGWGSSRRYIFMGSYDVFYSEDDGPRYLQMMIHSLNEARDLGLIRNESGQKEWRQDENWYLTEKGENLLKDEANKAYLKCAMMRTYVLQCILEFIKDKPQHKFKSSDIGKMDKYHVGRCLGDLAKTLPLYIQLDADMFNPFWTMNTPTIEQIAKALDIARTGGDCTTWNPDWPLY